MYTTDVIFLKKEGEEVALYTFVVVPGKLEACSGITVKEALDFFKYSRIPSHLETSFKLCSNIAESLENKENYYVYFVVTETEEETGDVVIG